jgi:hypothetical protein
MAAAILMQRTKRPLVASPPSPRGRQRLHDGLTATHKLATQPGPPPDPAMVCRGAALPLVTMKSLSPFLESRLLTGRRACCAAKEKCEGHRIIAKLGEPCRTLPPFRPSFVAELATNDRCILCCDHKIQQTLCDAMWTSQPITMDQLTHRYPTNPTAAGNFPLPWLKKIGIVAGFHLHTHRMWRLGRRDGEIALFRN